MPIRTIILSFLVSIFICSPGESFCKEKNGIEQYLDLASVYKEKMNYPEAIKILEDNKQYLDDIDSKNFLARLYYLDGESEKAIDLLNSENKKNWVSYVFLGLSYEDKANNTLAVKNYLLSLKLNPNSVALYRLGKIYYNRKLYSKASRFFSEVVKLDSSMRLANYYLAECFLKKGDYKTAYTYSSRGINFYPQNQDIRKQLLEIKDKIGKAFFMEAKRTIERARGLVKLMFYKREKNIPLIKVGLASGLNDFTFRCGGSFIIKDSQQFFTGKKDKFYTVVFKNNRLYLKDYEKDIIYKKFKSPVTIKSQGYPFYILDLAYGHENFWHKKIDRIYRGDLKVVAYTDIALINILSIEEYLYGVLPSEILASSEKEALKAQAVAARTLAYQSIKQQRHKNENFDVCADVHCQVYQGMSVENIRTNKAVADTKGEVLLYGALPIEAIYHSNCGGCMRPDTFGHKKDYYGKGLDSKKTYLDFSSYGEELWFMNLPDSFCSHSFKSNYRWQRVYDSDDFYLVFGYKLKDLERIVPVEKNELVSYRAIEIKTSHGKDVIKGDLNIRNYFDKLRSSSFKVDVKFSSKKEAQMLFFWGAGFGHGVGMCQEGAQFMAREGYTYQEILTHYYPHTEVVKKY